MDTAVDLAPQQAGGLENAQVLGDRGERDMKWGGEFADGGFALCKTRENGAAGGIGKRSKCGIQGRIVNHMV
jgi:hypothetical protein